MWKTKFSFVEGVVYSAIVTLVLLVLFWHPRLANQAVEDETVTVVVDHEDKNEEKGQTSLEDQSDRDTGEWRIDHHGTNIQTVVGIDGSYVIAGSIQWINPESSSSQPSMKVRRDLFLLVNPTGPVPQHALAIPRPAGINPQQLDVTAQAISPDGKRVAVNVLQHRRGENSDLPLGQIHIKSVATGMRLRSLPIEGSIRHLAFSPDGRYLAAGIDDFHGQVSVYDTKNGHRIWSLSRKGEEFRQVSLLEFSPDSQFLFIGGYEDAGNDGRTWFYRIHLPSGKRRNLSRFIPLARIVPESEPDVWSPLEAAFTSDGQTMALGIGEGMNGRIQIWDLKRLQVKRTLKDELWEPQALAFSPSNRTLSVAHGVLHGDSPGAGLDHFDTTTWKLRQKIEELDRTVADLRYTGNRLFGYTGDLARPMIRFSVQP